MICSCGGKFYSLEVRPYKKNGILQRRRYECRKCHKVISVAEVKLYAVRKAVME